MSPLKNVAIHASQFPDAVRRDLLDSLRSRQVNHKFHYDSFKQTQKWLALHQAYSPSRTDDQCAATYDRAFAEAARRIEAESVHLIGLGCGGGQKDTRLLRLLQRDGRKLTYTPSDVSVAMVLVASETAQAVISRVDCFPLVCDLATTDDLPAVLGFSENGFEAASPAAEIRLLTFFGMIPNFEPQIILPRLAAALCSEDFLLFSANMAPGADYAEGVRRILPLYDNSLTRDWLMTFLLDLGMESADGELRFSVEDDSTCSGLKRVEARFHFARPHVFRIENEDFAFAKGESIRLFFSYRHTPQLIRTLLSAHGIEVLNQWITDSEEEGVFLCRRATHA